MCKLAIKVLERRGVMEYAGIRLCNLAIKVLNGHRVRLCKLSELSITVLETKKDMECDGVRLCKLALNI